MRFVVRIAQIVLLTLLAGCTSRPPDSVQIDSVQPARWLAGASPTVEISGRGFLVSVHGNLDSGRIRVDDGYSGTIGRIALVDVAWVSTTRLTAVALPSIPPGIHDLTIARPDGAEASLPSAITVVVDTGAEGGEPGDPGLGDSGLGDPGFGDPGFGDPGFGDPFGDPGFGDPGFGDPGPGDPGVLCGSAGASWYANPAYTQRERLCIDGAQIAGDLTDFPVLVSLSRAALTAARVDGFDILFTGDDGTTELDHEIESWDQTSGRLLAWVRFPTLTAGTNEGFFVYFDNVGESVDQQNPWGVWDASYAAVWHLRDDTASTVLDSTANANHGTKAGADHPLEEVGFVESAQAFDGIDDFIDVGSNASMDDIFADGGTIEAWIYAVDYGESSFGRIIDKAATTVPSGGWALAVNDTTASQAVFFGRNYDGSNGLWAADDVINLGTWQHVVVTYDASNAPSFYVDGQLQTTTEYRAPAGSPSSDADSDATIGNCCTGTQRSFDGLIDELRMSTTIRSPAWIETSYNNVSDPAGFLIEP